VNGQTDSQLLCAYAEHRSEPAFAELVRRHLDFVYSAALRMVCDSHLAKDVTQCAFLALAKNAAQLTDRPVLSGWLHRTAHNIAAQTVRSDVRRRAREQEAAAMNELHEPDAVWEDIAPHLDDALGELSEADRDALLLRYFEGKSARQIALTLGTSEDAAQKRVSRAVERLREFLAKRGATVGGSGLVVVISAHAVQAAPVGLATAISTAAALAGTSLAATATATATKAIAMTNLQKAIVTGTLAVAVGKGIYQAQQASTLRSQVQMLQQQQAPFVQQIGQLNRERDDATRQMAALRDENERLNRNTAELLRLRGEVSLLRRAQNKPAPSDNATSLPSATTTSQDQVEANIGRELGLAVVQGDSGALDKLVELSKTAQKSFNTNQVGLDDTERGKLAFRTFAFARAAFDVIGEAAGNGNPVAVQAVERALQISELKGHAVEIVGTLAGKGNEFALEMLLNPDNYGILLSSSVFALRPAAERGNQRAIDALSAITKDANNQALWVAAADGLAIAAESGNAAAVDALVRLSSSTNQNVRNAVVPGLKKAAANQNTKAAETLRSMDIQ
jgi:RNA polymerase sigma factor (sigma-70 family)